MAKIAPSVLGADFSRLAEEIADAERVGVDMFHLDIMDGHFVPNISFGPDIVRTIDKLTDKFLDVHLMLTEPEKYFDAFCAAGADSITFHIEIHPQPTKFVKQIREGNIKAGISLNPDTPVEKVLPYVELFDFLLVMSVFPGFGGQGFIESVIPKIATVREFIDTHSLHTQIQVDGGVDDSNSARIVKAGADILVMGTGFFGSADRKALVRKVQSIKR
ncbi:MAG: ribulose-phosphate 3-epimerase [Candidatus Zixiibacteriota bacterium]